MFCLCVLAYLYGLGVNTKQVLTAVYGNGNILAYFLCKPCRQLTPDIELPAADKIRQIILAFIVQSMKQKIFTVEPERLGSYAESHDFEVREFGNNATSGYIPKFIYTISGEILADSKYSDEICYEVAHKQSNSS